MEIREFENGIREFRQQLAIGVSGVFSHTFRGFRRHDRIPLKAFGNWRVIFKAGPQAAERKLLYRRRGLSPPLSPPLSPLLSPGLVPSHRRVGLYRDHVKAIGDVHPFRYRGRTKTGQLWVYAPDDRPGSGT